MKSFVFVAALLCLSMVAHAECVVSENSVMYINPERFFNVLDVAQISQVQAKSMMTNDLADGFAIRIAAGTRLDEVKKISDSVSGVRVGNLRLIALNVDFKCR